MMHDAMTLADDGPVAIRYPRGRGAQRRRARGRHRDRRPQGPRSDSSRPCASSASARCSKLPRRRPTSWAPTASTSRCGTSRCCAPLDPVMLADAASHRARRHGRGRRPRRRHRHDDRRSRLRDRPFDPRRRARAADQVHAARSEVGQHPRPLRARRGGPDRDRSRSLRSPCCGPNGCCCAGCEPTMPRCSPRGATIPRSRSTRTG